MPYRNHPQPCYHVTSGVVLYAVTKKRTSYVLSPPFPSLPLLFFQNSFPLVPVCTPCTEEIPVNTMLPFSRPRSTEIVSTIEKNISSFLQLPVQVLSPLNVAKQPRVHLHTATLLGEASWVLGKKWPLPKELGLSCTYKSRDKSSLTKNDSFDGVCGKFR